MLRLEQMQALLKTEPDDLHDKIIDVTTVSPPCRTLKVKEEEQEADMEPKFFLGPSVSAQFVSEAAQQVRSLRAGGGRVKSRSSVYTSSLSDRGELPACGGGEKRVCSSCGRDDPGGGSDCLKCEPCCFHCPRKQVPFSPECVSVCV